MSSAGCSVGLAMNSLHALPDEDAAAWLRYPDHRGVYNRLEVSEGAPMGVIPSAADFPLIVKPIINLWGMGRGAVRCETMADFEAIGYLPGYMWSRWLSGPHASVDAVIEDGRVVWQAHAWGISSGVQRFCGWLVGVDMPSAARALQHFVEGHLQGYTGALNIEMIGGKVIEAHLRLTQDWLAAEAYDDFPGPARRMVGVPVFSALEHDVPGATVIPDDGDPRHAFVVVACDNRIPRP
jgi:hypothetical protein